MPEVREGVGEGAEQAKSAAEIPTVDGGTGGQVDRESGSSGCGREFGADSGARRTGFRGERENDSGVKTNTIPG
jgi:hypothetical protein